MLDRFQSSIQKVSAGLSPRILLPVETLGRTPTVPPCDDDDDDGEYTNLLIGSCTESRR